MPDKIYLRQMQALPLIAKVRMSQQRIREWYDHFDGNVFISFSGGKDSTVLAHVVHEYYPDVPLVFCNTGLEYPEVRQFAEKMGAISVYPKMQFDKVISTYGYPIISKENAEAIHYARKIVNSNIVGGGTGTLTQSEKNSCANGVAETFGNQRTQSGYGGGGTTKSLFKGRTGWRRAALQANLPVKLIGNGGEDEPLPG